jgi:hypothetical protein
MAAKPEEHVGFEDGGQVSGAEDVYPQLLADLALLASRADHCAQPAIWVEEYLDEWHAKCAALGTHYFPKPLRIEVIEHEQDTLGGAALKR